MRWIVSVQTRKGLIVVGECPAFVAVPFSNSLILARFDVESITRHRIALDVIYNAKTTAYKKPAKLNKGSIEYFVKWKACEEQTWESEKNLRCGPHYCEDLERTLTDNLFVGKQFLRSSRSTAEASPGVKKVLVLRLNILLFNSG
jgi:hypothetical protein